MPSSSASGAMNLRADSIRSAAAACPIRRGRVQLMPCSAIRPRRAKAVVNDASRDAKRMSQNSA